MLAILAVSIAIVLVNTLPAGNRVVVIRVTGKNLAFPFVPILNQLLRRPIRPILLDHIQLTPTHHIQLLLVALVVCTAVSIQMQKRMGSLLVIQFGVKRITLIVMKEVKPEPL